MSGTDISTLSYKELQALALRYRVPGNIKKQLLIEVLQAARCGNEQEVDKLLSDLRQTRKKRIRKGKPAKLNLSSTPIHSPSYDMADDYYNAQHRLPYQWVGAEEEIPNRQDDANRIPQYEEFRQFLLRRIQRDCQTYGGNNIERIDSGDPGCPRGLMDLRNESESMRFDAEQIGMRSSLVPVNSLESGQLYSDQIQAQSSGTFDYQILEDPNGNGHASILLRRMLQAPVGADLGEIASPELPTSCRVWPTEYHQAQNNLLDNSDTLSANSEVNGNEENWPNGAEYYRFINNVRDHLILNPTAAQACNRNFYDQSTPGHQFTGVEIENPVQYQLVYTNQIPEANQQTWEPGNAAFDSEQQTLNHYQNLKQYAASYNANSHRPLQDIDPLQLPYPGGEDAVAIYSTNQNGLENQPGNDCNASNPAASRTEVKFYQNLQGVAAAINGRQIDDADCDFALGRSPVISASVDYNAGGIGTQHPDAEFTAPMQNLHQFSSPSQQTVDHSEPIVDHHHHHQEFNQPSILIGQYNNINNQQENHHNALVEKINAPAECQQFLKPLMDTVEVEEARFENRNKTAGSATMQEAHGGPTLESFWPQRSAARNLADSSSQLENILNLNTCGYVDYSKIDQTSCIYCYAAPIVTQRTFSGSSSSCSQKRRFIAEFRQHTFSPYWLLYSDAKTGLQMSKSVEAIDSAERQEGEGKPRNEEEEKNDDEHGAAVPLNFEGPQNARLQVVDNDSPFRIEEHRHQLPAELIAEENSAVDDARDAEICSLDANFAPIPRTVESSGTNDPEKTQIVADKLLPENRSLDQNGNCNLPETKFPANSSTTY